MVRYILTFCAVLLGAAPAFAQDSSWGVAGTLVPKWNVPEENALSTVLFDAERVDVNGSEFRIGFVRGRMLSGDWGVSYVRRRIDDGSTIVSESFSDPELPGLTLGETLTTRGIQIDGLEVHKFTPFGTIKRRVQIGLLFGGGIGFTKGVIESRQVFPDFVQVGNSFVVVPREVLETRDAEELIYPGNGLVPLGRLEVAVAGLVAPGLKVRASGGLAFPGVQTFSITGLYLFGGR
jgi:hypothetical protein